MPYPESKPVCRGRHGYPTIGVLAGWQYYWTATPLSYLAPLFRAIRLATHELGCNLLLGCGMGSSASPDAPLRPAWPVLTPESDFVPIGPWNTDGLLVINPLHSAARSHYLQGLIASGHPVVFIASGERGPTIVADNAGGTLEAIRHLVEHGHRSIAFIAGSPDDIEGDTGTRLRAYQKAVRTFGLTADGRLIAYGLHNYEGGHAAMRQILAAAAPFTALMASNDESAMGAMLALREAGLRVPQDVAVIGFDDRPEDVVQEPALSSVRVPLFEIGWRAVEILLRQIEGHGAPAGPVQVPTRLMMRESCGCKPSTAPDKVSTRKPGAARASPTAQLRAAEAMANAVLAEAQELNAATILSLCQQIVVSIVASTRAGDRREFWQALDTARGHVGTGQDDPHLWQAAISVLREQLPALMPPLAQDLARGWLDAARVAISAAIWHQHRLHIVNERQARDRVSLLTARLLAALDEKQATQILAQDLPAMGVHVAALALFEAEGDDPVAWSVLQSLVPQQETTLRFRSRDHPPAGLLEQDQPFSLALIPLTGPRDQRGYVTFDTDSLDLYGAVVQQLAAALNTAQLYREATEGRRLAEEANQLKSRFLSMVSHELRTPLSLIVGLSSILLQERDQAGAPLPPPLRKDIERILASAQHLGWLISDVLDLASSEAGQLRLAHELVDMSDALRPVAETGRQLAADKGLAWRESLPGAGPWVWGDRTRLRQVALNLVHNAVKFTTQGEVRLAIVVGPGHVTVEVDDTGLGISADEQELIFSEFGRSERSIARGYGGLGLGLSICKRLVEMHGGTVGVRSSGQEGAGSTFYFTLPVVLPAALEADLASRPVAPEKVLLFTSQPDEIERLGEHLAQHGVAVEVCEAAADWLHQVMCVQPAVILLDASMTSERGWQMIQALRRDPATRGIPLLLYSPTSTGVAIFELDYWTKPVGPAELSEALDQRLPMQDAGHPARTILVVDDDPDTVAMHARIVRAHAPTHRVVKAYSGRTALEVLRREHVDLVLLDLLMPEMDGFAVLESMREAENMRDVPVIVLTGQMLTEGDMARLSRGVATVLGKGLFSLDETLAHVTAALEHRRRLGNEARRLVRKAMAFLHEHYAEPISRQSLAGHVGMDDDYLTSCFRKELGVTPVVYLNRYRVQQAKRLLTDTDASITEIALEVGFSDSGYFSRIFRREVGCSPDAYRHRAPSPLT